jgi:hypothetical protein
MIFARFMYEDHHTSFLIMRLLMIAIISVTMFTPSVDVCALILRVQSVV